jgi:LAS superfamily LD-carboxypeptidase LdcB
MSAKTTGGSTKTINGVLRKNGEIEDLLVSIKPELYKRHWSSYCQSDGRRIRLQALAMQNLENLLQDAFNAGIYIKVNSAYRTYDDQVIIKEKSTNIPAATPGCSNHGFGAAVDLADRNGVRINPKTTLKEWEWIQTHKQKYKFANISGFSESHHYNFIG